MLGPKRDENGGRWRMLHNEELYNLYHLPNMLRAIKTRRLEWTGYLVRME
jgi:hypothetical protein